MNLSYNDNSPLQQAQCLAIQDTTHKLWLDRVLSRKPIYNYSHPVPGICVCFCLTWQINHREAALIQMLSQRLHYCRDLTGHSFHFPRSTPGRSLGRTRLSTRLESSSKGKPVVLKRGTKRKCCKTKKKCRIVVCFFASGFGFVFGDFSWTICLVFATMVFATFWYFKRSCGFLEVSLGFHLGLHLSFH